MLVTRLFAMPGVNADSVYANSGTNTELVDGKAAAEGENTTVASGVEDENEVTAEQSTVANPKLVKKIKDKLPNTAINNESY